MGIFAAIVYLVMMSMLCGTVILVTKMWMEHQNALESKRQDTIRARQMQTAPYWDALGKIAEARALGVAHDDRVA